LEAGDEAGDEQSPARHEAHINPLVIRMRSSTNCPESIKSRNTGRSSEVAIGATAHRDTL
jgi:hypothetical protein